ncbi:unnamed protein product [Rotaria sordida]|uniref:PDZ domain-containing protein n=1 Tax=Rotaria sordida TaxID=392033 RepID=A0A814MLY7_9BILA|nr:unnamed protein product [Rotaria sordida]
MAKFYENLQKSLTSYEDRPKAIITEQTFSESAYLIRGKDRRRSAWYYILIPTNKFADLKVLQSDAKIDIPNFGRLIEYLDNRDEIKPMSGWGINPPKIIQTWIAEHYDSASIDENISLIYEKDDIRLCTMQRAIPEQKLGFFLCYYRKQHFYYIKFYDDSESSLGYRAGIKNFDRIIALNGVNIEQDTIDQLLRRFNVDRHLPVQMLVCSPATYAYYRSNEKLLHSDLSTVQHLKPVYATSMSDFNRDTSEISVDNESFYAVQWENGSIVSTVPQSAIFKSSEFTSLNDICFIETEGQYRKGQIIFQGSYDDCEKFKMHSVSSVINNVSNTLPNLFIRKTSNFLDSTTNLYPDSADNKSVSSLNVNTKFSSQKSSQKLETDTIQAQITIQDVHHDTTVKKNTDAIQHIQDRICTTLEKLPNELFFYLFTFIDIQYLYSAFWGLNSRLNNIIQSCKNLSLTVDEKIDPLLMKLYAPYVNRLIIQISIDCDFSQFPNLHTLILCYRNLNHLAQIQSKIIPNLTHLSFLLGSKFTPPRQLICDVFSNKFPSLRHIKFGHIYESTCNLWTISPSLRFVSILSCKRMTVLAILASCPNLHHLQLRVLYKKNNTVLLSPPLNHSLRRFILWSDYAELTYNDIDNLLSYIPNIEYLYLQTVYSMSFIDLADNLINRLHHLSQFDCYIKEMLTNHDRIGNLNCIHRIHPCFNQIQCIEENDKFRIFATK